MINKSIYSSASQQWYTPEWLMEPIYKFFGDIPDLDPCAGFGSPVRAKQYYYGGNLKGCYRDGLDAEWHGNVFMNPPYGRDIGPWILVFTAALYDRGIALLPARTDTEWFQLISKLPMCFIKGRLKFGGAKNGAPFPSVLVLRPGLIGDAVKFTQIFSSVGFVK